VRVSRKALNTPVTLKAFLILPRKRYLKICLCRAGRYRRIFFDHCLAQHNAVSSFSALLWSPLTQHSEKVEEILIGKDTILFVKQLVLIVKGCSADRQNRVIFFISGNALCSKAQTAQSRLNAGSPHFAGIKNARYLRYPSHWY